MFFSYKKKIGKIKLMIFPQKAKAVPPISSILGQKGINILEFCKEFNNKTINIDNSYLIPVLINYYSDKSYDLFLKKPTVNFYLKNIYFDKLLSFINYKSIIDIVKFKIFDFNSCNFFSCLKIVFGVLKSMNINIKI